MNEDSELHLITAQDALRERTARSTFVQRRIKRRGPRIHASFWNGSSRSEASGEMRGGAGRARENSS